ncbi:MAG TPA: VIT1/CCC1 transporter family protein, partial [Actinomycetota bacterium]|nr:VIT1/CCC1 transporter family protein [Actinomycetota bacterium]
SPWGAATSSFVAFGLGALIPLVPYFFADGTAAAWTAVGLSLSALFVIGSALSRFTNRTWLWSGLRMLGIGGGAALVTYWVGRLLHVTVT